MEESLDTCHEKFLLFAQSLFGMVALSHVQLVTVDVILQTYVEQGRLEILCKIDSCKIKFLTSSSVEKEKAEKLLTAALSNNETNGLSKF